LINQTLQQPYPIASWGGSFYDPNQGQDVDCLIYYPNVTTGEKFPLIVFEPGYIFANTFYDYLWELFVPNGYIMALDGTYNYDPNEDPNTAALDMAFLLDYIHDHSKNDPNFFLYHMVNDLSASMGHSNGAGASILSADPAIMGNNYTGNFTTIVPLSPCGGDHMKKALEAEARGVSLFLITGSIDCICPPEDCSYVFYEQSKAPCKFIANIVDASHCLFADPNLVDYQLCWDLETILGCGLDYALDYSTETGFIMNYTYPWLQYFLKGDKTGLTTLNKILASDASKGNVYYNVSCSNCV